jgi:hypothetical protein
VADTFRRSSACRVHQSGNDVAGAALSGCSCPRDDDSQRRGRRVGSARATRTVPMAVCGARSSAQRSQIAAHKRRTPSSGGSSRGRRRLVAALTVWSQPLLQNGSGGPLLSGASVFVKGPAFECRWSPPPSVASHVVGRSQGGGGGVRSSSGTRLLARRISSTAVRSS